MTILELVNVFDIQILPKKILPTLLQSSVLLSQYLIWIPTISTLLTDLLRNHFQLPPKQPLVLLGPLAAQNCLLVSFGFALTVVELSDVFEVHWLQLENHLAILNVETVIVT